ncbi:MAG TPA: tetratricopeptide repeat protein, partial [Cellvibrionaceae bacterium]|nr:tetratricopeptide repeat protein [Cellvibrionaceae bacterium]
AQAAYQAGNYQTAISTAERGLRIDRRAPALYLVMAQSYLALNQPTQAAQFANQGLRFSQSGSAEARALEKVRNGAGE